MECEIQDMKIFLDLKPEETGKFLYPKTSLKTIDLAGRLAQEGIIIILSYQVWLGYTYHVS